MEKLKEAISTVSWVVLSICSAGILVAITIVAFRLAYILMFAEVCLR